MADDDSPSGARLGRTKKGADVHLMKQTKDASQSPKNESNGLQENLWSRSRRKAWEQREENPEDYYYYYTDPGVDRRSGPWSDDEKQTFFARLSEIGADVGWGVFSIGVPGRPGVDCEKLFLELLESGSVTDFRYVHTPKGMTRREQEPPCLSKRRKVPLQLKALAIAEAAAKASTKSKTKPKKGRKKRTPRKNDKSKKTASSPQALATPVASVHSNGLSLAALATPVTTPNIPRVISTASTSSSSSSAHSSPIAAIPAITPTSSTALGASASSIGSNGPNADDSTPGMEKEPQPAATKRKERMEKSSSILTTPLWPESPVSPATRRQRSTFNFVTASPPLPSPTTTSSSPAVPAVGPAALKSTALLATTLSPSLLATLELTASPPMPATRQRPFALPPPDSTPTFNFLAEALTQQKAATESFVVPPQESTSVSFWKFVAQPHKETRIAVPRPLLPPPDSPMPPPVSSATKVSHAPKPRKSAPNLPAPPAAEFPVPQPQPPAPTTELPTPPAERLAPLVTPALRRYHVSSVRRFSVDDEIDVAEDLIFRRHRTLKARAENDGSSAPKVARKRSHHSSYELESSDEVDEPHERTKSRGARRGSNLITQKPRGRPRAQKENGQEDRDGEVVHDNAAAISVVGNTRDLDMDICLECGAGGAPIDFLCCVDCGETIHSYCLDPPIQLPEASKANWRCPDCKLCEICLKGENEDQLLVCDKCDSGFHMYCLPVPLTQVPEGRWLCHRCVQCQSCKVRDSDRWSADYQYCGNCADLLAQGNICHVCKGIYRESNLQVAMIKCNQCNRWIHTACDELGDQECDLLSQQDQLLEYWCPPCRELTWTAPPLSAARRHSEALLKLLGRPLPAKAVANHKLTPPVAATQSHDSASAVVATPGSSTTEDNPAAPVQDWRVCLLCSQAGDQVLEGRLLPLLYEYDQYVHVNCALWTRGIWEDVTGGLWEARTSLKHALETKCCVCSKPGASLACMHPGCTLVMHLPCALGASCQFASDRKFFCSSHRNPTTREMLDFASARKIYIMDKGGKGRRKKGLRSGPGTVLRRGCLQLRALGQIIPTSSFFTADELYPVGFCSVRKFWSTVDPNIRVKYRFEIRDGGNHPVFVLAEEDNPQLNLTSISLPELYQQLVTAVNDLRVRSGLLQRRSGVGSVTPSSFFGIAANWISQLLDMLPRVNLCMGYNRKQAVPSSETLFEPPLPELAAGCARAEGLSRAELFKHKRERLQQRNSQSAARRGPTSLGYEDEQEMEDTNILPMLTRYKQMKSKLARLRVGPSQIQGLGVYSCEAIHPGEMIVEYVGEIIRPSVADVREKYYDSHGIGCYMFGIDWSTIVDATMKGNIARFINHSCEPNAYSRIVDISGQKKIVLIAKALISPDEEISYDYKFEYEDNKLPCLCGAVNCRGFIN